MGPRGDTQANGQACPDHGSEPCGNRQRCVQTRWLLAATIFGAFFPLVGWATATSAPGVDGLAAAHAAQPVLYIVDLAPLVLGLTGYAIGHFHARLIKIRHSIEQTVQTRTAELQEALNALSSAQAELLNAQKLEAIGGLAAGIAHEINTPIQYVSDNTRFVEQSLAGLLEVAASASQLADAVQHMGEAAGVVAAYTTVADKADLEFLSEEIPSAIEESLDGIDQVASIVKALKSFAHPGSQDRVPEDINELITVTCDVARNEWKYVADLNLDGLDKSIPKVPILSGPLKQVFLNLVVNSAQAIEESIAEGAKGEIAITTRTDGNTVVAEIRDNGAGIPENIQDRVTEPFFTTKDVGKGSGQGLAIARSIVEKHEGSLTFVSTPGVGTTFAITLPLKPEAIPAKV